MAVIRRKSAFVLAVVLAIAGAIVGVPASSSAQPTGGAVAGFTSIELQVGGNDGVPVDAEMAALHVAVAGSDGPGFVTLWPCTDSRPTTSSVNYLPGQVVQSLVLARLSDTGSICVFVRETTDVIVDVAGFVPAGSDLTALDTPTRLVDTRLAEPLAPRSEFRVQIGGRAGVAADAAGVGFTITAVDGTDPGFATVYPCDTPRPQSSSVNWLPGQVVPNFVIADLGVTGEVCVWALTEVDVLIDVVAWIPDGAEGYELLSSPRRVLDSRSGDGTEARPFGERESRSIPVGAPDGAVAVIGNLTATNQSGPGFATVFPCGESVPTTASLNWLAPPVAVNASLGTLGEGGEPCVFARSETDLVYDVTGYVTSTDFYTPLTPFRLHDSRQGWEATCPFVPIVTGGVVGQQIVLFTGDGDFTDDRTLSFPLPPDGGFDARFVVSKDCSTLFGSARAGDLIEIDVATGRRTVHAGQLPGSNFEIADDGAIVFARLMPLTEVPGDAGPHRLEVWDESGARASSAVFDLPHHFGMSTSAVSKDANHVVAEINTSGQRTIVFADLAANTIEVFQPPTISFIHGLEIAPDGRSFVVNAAENLPADDGGPPESVESFLVVSPEGLILRSGSIRSSYPLVASYRGNGELLACSAAGSFREVLFADFELIQWFVDVVFNSDPSTAIGQACIARHRRF